MSATDREHQAGRGAASKLRQATAAATTKAAEVAQHVSHSKAASRRLGKYVIAKNSAGKYNFTLHAANGQVIATSEVYESRAAALNGISSVRRNAVQARLVDETSDAP